MKEISRLTGLSIATVSHAINGTRRVSDKSLSLVEKAAEKIGYKPSLAAQILRTQKSEIIALIIPSSHPTNDTNSFYFGMLNGARSALEKRGYDMIVSTYPESSASVDLSKLQVLQTRIIDGLLIVPNSRKKGTLSGLNNLKVPIVLLDRTVEEASFSVVRSDNFGVTKRAVKELIESGHKRIGFIGGKERYSTVKERLEGYKSALEDCDIPFDNSLVCMGYTDKAQQGIEATQQLVEKNVDAVFIENAMLTIGAVTYCKNNNISIPKDLAIIGYDNAPWMEITSPLLSAIQQSAERIGEEGASLLIDFIEKKKTDNEEIIIPAEIVLRSSHK